MKLLIVVSHYNRIIKMFPYQKNKTPMWIFYHIKVYNYFLVLFFFSTGSEYSKAPFGDILGCLWIIIFIRIL